MTANSLEQLSAEVEIGEAARDFVASDLGRTVLGMAKQEVDAAMIEFADADPSDLAKLRTLQIKVKFGLTFEQWLTELITRGNEALEVYRHHEQKN